jgi:transposase
LMHRRWMAGLKFEQAAHHIVLEDCIAAVETATARRDRLEAHIKATLPDWSLAPVVHALQALRGMALVAAATVIAELGDITRFANLRQLMAYLGLVPSEHSSGATRRQGGITKAGNGAARRMLIEAAWSYRFPARIKPGATVAAGGSGKADPRHGRPRAAVSALSQARQGGKIIHRGHDRDRSRTGGFCLGDRQACSGRRRLMRQGDITKGVVALSSPFQN